MYFIKESPRFLLINKDKVFIKSMISKLEMHDKKALLPIKEKSSDSNSIYRKIVESSEQIIIKDELEIIENLNTLGEIVQTDINKTKSIFDFILNKSDDKRNFFILCIIWFFTSSTFYSILISIKNLAGNVYLITIIIFMLQIFCNLGSAQMMNNKNLSRVRSINILEACCVLTLLCLIIFSNIPLAKITFVVCLRLFVAMIYCIIYICSVEFYPTEFRATCLSVNSICGRLGASIIPFFIEYLGDYYYVYCLSVFILCFILSFFLTEKNYLEEEI